MSDPRFWGVWSLHSFRILKDEIESDWGLNTTGRLIYTDNGDVCLGLNKEPENLSSDAYRAIYDATLFYIGTFQVLDRSQVCHEVHQASDPKHIGQSFVRKFRFINSHTLELTGEGEFGVATLIWKKLDTLKKQ